MKQGRYELMRCPVCRGAAIKYFLRVGELDYWLCQDCQARFLAPGQRPQRSDEYAHYLLHENDPDDPGYRKFLSKLADPLVAKLDADADRHKRMQGLDYGCGPGAALAAMLREQGFDVALYDPFFQPDRGALRETYDFITCTETAEHFHHPAEEFDRLDQILRPGGWLAVMTCFQTDDDRFARWHYRADPTHVVFYRVETFQFIAQQRGWACEIVVKDVALMRKPVSSAVGVIEPPR